MERARKDKKKKRKFNPLSFTPPLTDRDPPKDKDKEPPASASSSSSLGFSPHMLPAKHPMRKSTTRAGADASHPADLSRYHQLFEFDPANLADEGDDDDYAGEGPEIVD